MNKKFIYFTAVIALCIGFASCINITNTSKRGCGNIVTSERTVSAFEEINAGNSANVRFHIGEEFRAVLSIDENLYEYVEIETRNNTLRIQTIRRGSFSPTQFTVDVYAPTLSGVTLSGVGSFENVEKLIVPSFEMNLSGAGTITGTIESENFSARISGAGNIRISGSSKNADFRLSGAGGLRGSNFIVNNAVARVSGAGSMDIYVTDDLNATVSGVGSISYRGNPPRVESRVSGVGSVNRVN